MGTSNFSGSWGNNLTLEIISGWNTQSTIDNKSKLNVQVFLSASSYAMISTAETRPLTMTIDGGQEIIQVNPSISQGQRKAILQKDYIINHNSDGTKPQFNISAKFDINISNYGSATATQAIRLPDIKRASTSSNISGAIGASVTINITRQSTAFKHNIKYDFKGSTGTIASNIDTTYAWTIPTSFAALMPNEMSGTGNLIIETMSGTSKVGETKYTMTISIPNTATFKPTLSSITLSDTNTKTASLITGNTFVSLLSTIKVTFGTATGNNGSTIASYNAEIVGKGLVTNGQNSTFGLIDFVGAATVRATVTDSRGMTSAPVDIPINVIDYFLPIVTNLKITRAQSDPNIFQLSPIVKIAPLMVGGVQKNQLKITTSVAPYDTKVYTVDNGAATGVWSTISGMTGGLLNLSGSYDKSKTWLVKVSVSDSLNPASESTQSVSSEFVLICKAPKGIGAGKIWERGIADLNGDVFVSGKTETKSLVVDGFAITKQIIFDIAHPVGEIFETNDPRNPNVYFGMGTWARFGNGKVLVGVDETDTDFNVANKTGGEKAHVLTEPELASHSHGQNVSTGSGPGIRRDYQSDGAGAAYPQGISTQNAGGNQAHNNLQPYITVYRWQRTA